MALKKYMTPEEHNDVAHRLRSIIREMEELGKLAMHTYGASSRIGKLGERLFTTGNNSALQKLRSLFDDCFYQEGYGRAAWSPYYGRKWNEEAQSRSDEVAV